MRMITNQMWSLRTGKYQTYHTVRAENHKIPNMTDLTTPSYYTSNGDVVTCEANRLFFGTVMYAGSDRRVTYGNEVWFRFTGRGFVRVEAPAEVCT
jgi:hypothetical protein